MRQVNSGPHRHTRDAWKTELNVGTRVSRHDKMNLPEIHLYLILFLGTF